MSAPSPLPRLPQGPHGPPGPQSPYGARPGTVTGLGAGNLTLLPGPALGDGAADAPHDEPYTGFGDLTQPLAPLLTASSPQPAPLSMRPQSAPLAGRYRLDGQLGSGGAGTVWAAYDPVLARPVAIKTLPAHLPRGERKRLGQRFLDEARAAAKLEHAHIVSVFDAGVDDGPDGAGAYIVMSLLRGKDLKRLLANGWRPTAREACRLVQRIAEALAYAHALGVVHRDIKPANIVLVGRARPVVLDFGLAHQALAGGLLDGHDAEAQTAGSPYYIAPEQFEGLHGDRRSDIYALGVLMYELLTGQRPHEGRTLGEIRAAVLAGHAVPPSHHNPEADAALDAVVAHAMARDPEQRPRNAAELARELRHWRLAQRTAVPPQAGFLQRWWPRLASFGRADR